MPETYAISDAEWQVMNLLWEEQRLEAQLVIERLAAPNDWSAATVKTMLHRLVKKGVVSFEKEGRRYLYRTAVDRSACVRQASRSFLERVFGGAAAPALMHLAKNAKLTEEEIAELRALLDSKQSKKK